MSPDTQPTKEAMEAAREVPLRGSWDGESPCQCVPHVDGWADSLDSLCPTHEAIAAALDAYAAELQVQVREAYKLVADRNNAFKAACDERDAALAKLEAAEAALAEAAREIQVAGPVAHRIRVLRQTWQDELVRFRQRAEKAEERVRVLESAQAKVREWAIVDEIHGGKRGDDPEWRGQSCLLCRRRGKLVIWEVGEPERHAPECPAALAKAAAEGGRP